jgi:hypothetical protein
VPKQLEREISNAKRVRRRFVRFDLAQEESAEGLLFLRGRVLLLL